MEGVQAIERAFAVLKALADGGADGLRLIEVVAAVGLSKSTTHRLLRALLKAGAVDQDERTGAFHLGYQMLVFGAVAGGRYRLTDIARASLSRLAEMTGDTIYLSVRDRLDSVCLARTEGAFPIKTLTLNVGDRRPLGVGAGSLALLAFLPDEEVRSVVEANFSRPGAHPQFDEATVFGLVEQTRRQGYAINPGLIVPAMSAIGVPVRNRDGTVIAALSVAAIGERMRPPRRQSIVAWLEREAREIERLFLPVQRLGQRLA